MTVAQSFVTGSTQARVFTYSSGTTAGQLLSATLAQAVGEVIRVQGTTALASLATGVNTGTAGAGTTTTSVAKPTAAANWTTSDLKRKYFKPISGGGAPAAGAAMVAAPVLSNTTTTLTLARPIVGLDSTTVFEIVTLASLIGRISASDLNAIRALNHVGTLEIIGLDFSAVDALDSLLAFEDCFSVRVAACNVNQNTAAPAISVKRTGRVIIEDCVQTAAGDIWVGDGCRNVLARGNINYQGGVLQVEDFQKCDIQAHHADAAPSRVLALMRGGTANVEAKCDNGLATAVYFEHLAIMTATGNLITGTGNTGHGIEVAEGGQYNITGCTITGTAAVDPLDSVSKLRDVLFEGNRWLLYANHLSTTYGIVASAKTRLVAQVLPTKAIWFGNHLYDGSVDFSSRVLEYGIHNPAQNIALTATGTNKATAYQMPAGAFYSFGTVASGTGAIFDDASALAGPERTVVNKGANALTLYAPRGTIDGAASYSLAAGARKKFVINDYSIDEWFSL